MDPPYWDCEGDYDKDVFDRSQFAIMAGQMRSIRGRAIVSLNDVPGVREAFSGLRMETVTLSYTVGKATAKAVSEVIIYNFDAPELPLFGSDGCVEGALV